MSPLKIAYVSSSRIPSELANSVQVMRMAEAFSLHGHEVVLFARPGRGPGGDDHRHYGVTVSFRLVKCRWPRPDAVGAFVYAARVAPLIADRLRPDIVYARNLPVLVLLGRSSIPAVFEIHRPLTGGRLALARWLFRQPNFRRLVVVSDTLRDEYRRLCPGLDPARITVARSGVTPDDPAVPPASLHPPRDPSRIQVGYVGSGYPGKGIEVILSLAAQSLDFDFHVIGGV